ncbi:DoxX family protein [bacterium]|nr:DoxX family protein [bacterium]MDB4745576.1 DoxX family protein [Verrucomicrobiota bacterium]
MVCFVQAITVSLQALVAASIFFVWVVRYENIVSEFRQFGYPDWLRDLVGILKLTFSILLLVGIGQAQFALVGSIGIALLMLAALVTHLRVKNPPFMMMPSLSLMVLSVFISILNYQMLKV